MAVPDPSPHGNEDNMTNTDLSRYYDEGVYANILGGATPAGASAQAAQAMAAPGPDPCDEPGLFTVSDVIDHVDGPDGGADCAQRAYDAETADKGRVTLLDWLAGYLEHADGENGDTQGTHTP